MKYDTDLDVNTNLKNLLGCHSVHGIFGAARVVIEERDVLISMRNDLETLIKGNDSWKGNNFDSVTHLIEIANAPDTTQPQLSEIRYVLHGDIQPCSVLYSDDTTTLLRLDEGDIMCETDTIEWSDSVTYRCQELLKSVDVRSLGHVAPRLAQLVRDERILLNDNGEDVVKPEPLRDDELFLNAETLWRCTNCLHDFPSVCNRCPKCYTPKER